MPGFLGGTRNPMGNHPGAPGGIATVEGSWWLSILAWMNRAEAAGGQSTH